MARCLADESNAEETRKLETLLADDTELKADFELMKLLIYNKASAESKVNTDAKHFKKLSQRLKDEGLM
jgi:hypothetical protein